MKKILVLSVVSILLFLAMSVPVLADGPVYEEKTDNYVLCVYSGRDGYETVIHIVGKGKSYSIPIDYEGAVLISVANDMGDNFLRSAYFKANSGYMTEALPSLSPDAMVYYTADRVGKIRIGVMLFRRLPLMLR